MEDVKPIRLIQIKSENDHFALTESVKALFTILKERTKASAHYPKRLDVVTVAY